MSDQTPNTQPENAGQFSPPGFLHANTSEVVSERDTMIIGIVLSNDGIKSLINIYHGKNAKAPLVMKLSCPADDTKTVIPMAPLALPNGCYIEVGDAHAFYTVQYF